MDVKVRKKVEKLERKRAEVIVNHHIKRWNKMKLPSEVQLERITFILENREKHPRLLTKPIVEELEKVKTKLETKVGKKVEMVVEGNIKMQVKRNETGEVQYYSEMGKALFNWGAVGALAAGLSYSLGHFIPPQTALYLRIGGLLTCAAGLVGSVDCQYNFSKLSKSDSPVIASLGQACALVFFTSMALLDGVQNYYNLGRTFGTINTILFYPVLLLPFISRHD